MTLDLTFNAGAAFGVGTSYTAIIALIVCGVIGYIIRIARRLRSLAWTIALGLLLGGAMGNLGDRLFRAPGPLRGRVVDWINLPHFPWTFNLADTSITCAAVLIAASRCAASGSTGPPRRTPPTGSTARPRRPPAMTAPPGWRTAARPCRDPERVAFVTRNRIAATRAGYDAVAAAYAEAMSDELRRKPLDRALLTAFAEQVREPGRDDARVWDVGCGPGHVTAFLAGLGLRAAGVDLSDAMVAEARRRHPDLEFGTGSMTALPAADASWDGLVSFYSLIHMIDDADLRAALAEYRRVLADGGLLLLAVHAGEEVRHSVEWFGAEVDVSFRFFDPAWLSAELEQAGFAVESLTRRQPYPGAEIATPRAYFLARARAAS